jgi:hypothetical protein
MTLWVLGVAFLAAAPSILDRGSAPDPSSVARGGSYAPRRSLAGALCAPALCGNENGILAERRITALGTPVLVDLRRDPAVTSAAQAGAPSECPSGKPVKVLPSVIPALGQSPMWAATGGKPLPWDGPGQPARVLWLRDVAVKGAAMLSGKARTGTARVQFASSMYANREMRFKLDGLGDKPKGIKEADLLKYAFHWTFVWFPEPGCYEITARVGSQQSLIYLEAVSSGKKTT